MTHVPYYLQKKCEHCKFFDLQTAVKGICFFDWDSEVSDDLTPEMRWNDSCNLFINKNDKK
jgi:hypothetical protein